MADLREGENAPGTDIVIDSDEDEKENGDNGQKKPSAAQTLPVKAEAGGEKGGLERDDNDMDADDPESLEPLSNTHPSAPKRYMSAFFLYSEAKRESIKQANPSASPQEIAKLLSRDFKAMESEERAYWDGKAAEDKHEKALKRKSDLTSQAERRVQQETIANAAKRGTRAELADADEPRLEEVPTDIAEAALNVQVAVEVDPAAAALTPVEETAAGRADIVARVAATEATAPAAAEEAAAPAAVEEVAPAPTAAEEVAPAPVAVADLF